MEKDEQKVLQPVTAHPLREIAHVPLQGPAEELTAHASHGDEHDEPIVYIFRRLPKAA